MSDTGFNVDRGAYADALDIAVPGTGEEISVDRRGYAPAVAEEVGTSYMSDTILIGGRNQEMVNGPIQVPYDTMPDLVDAVYATDLPDHAAQDDPVVLHVQAEYNPDVQEFIFDTEPVYNEELEGLTAVEHVRREITDLGEDDLSDDGDITALTMQAGDLRDRFGPLDAVDTSFVSEARTTTSSFAFTGTGGGTGYMFSGSPPIVVSDQEASVPLPYDFDTQEYDIVNDAEEALNVLYDAGYICIDSDSVRKSIEDIGSSVLGEELSGVDFFRAMNEVDTPDTYDALHDLMVETELTFRQEADRIKLDHVETDDRTAEAVVDTVIERYEDILSDSSDDDTDQGTDAVDTPDISEWIIRDDPLEPDQYVGRTTERIQDYLDTVSSEPVQYR